MYIYTSYTYLLGWTNHNKWYYGVRFAKNCHKNELWKTYFTSSKHVQNFAKVHGKPDIIEIRKEFVNHHDALSWETKVLTRMKVLNDDKWLNKTTNKAICPIAASMGGSKPKSEEMKLNLSRSIKGRILSETHKKKISESRKGQVGYWKDKQLPDTTKKKLSELGKTRLGSKNPFYGRKHTEETRNKIRDSKRRAYMEKTSAEKHKILNIKENKT